MLKILEHIICEQIKVHSHSCKQKLKNVCANIIYIFRFHSNEVFLENVTYRV